MSGMAKKLAAQLHVSVRIFFSDLLNDLCAASNTKRVVIVRLPSSSGSSAAVDPRSAQ
jgi:hypothetical protein